MNEGRTIFSQLLEHAPHHHFRRCLERYRGNLGVRRFRCWDQFLCMVFSDNAVRTQIWIAICSYVLVAILKKRLDSELSLYTMLQILSVSLFEKIELSQAFSRAKVAMPEEPTCNQLQLFDL